MILPVNMIAWLWIELKSFAMNAENLCFSACGVKVSWEVNLDGCLLMLLVVKFIPA